MAVQVHMTQINDTYANMLAGMDNFQIGIRTDNNTQGYKALVWNDGANIIEAAAINNRVLFTSATISGNLNTDTLSIMSIATASDGLSAGDVWSDSGTLKIVS